MASFKLATYQSAQGPRAGIIVNDALYDAAEISGRPAYASVQAILDAWGVAENELRAAADRAVPGKGINLSSLKLCAPVLLPGDIYCSGANYKDHVAEMTPKGAPLPVDPHELGLKPWHFIKASRSITDPDAAVSVPPGCKKFDWEIELAAVIGRPARNLPVANALSCVAGYTVSNDLSARDLGFRDQLPETSPFRADWVAHKSFEGACPLGPWIIPARDIPDPQKLGLKLWVNDVLKQNSNTGQMIYTLAEQIAQLSSRATLRPGDIIMTGTPAGTAAAHGHYLKSGDVVKAQIEGIGTLVTRIG